MRLFKRVVFLIGIMVIGMVINVYHVYSTLEQLPTSKNSLNATSLQSLTSARTSQKEVVWYNYTVVGLNQFFILSVLATKSDQKGNWNLIAVTGWESGLAANKSYKCCFFDNYGNHSSVISIYKHKFYIRSKTLEATQVICKIPPDMIPTTLNLLLPTEDCGAIDNRKEIVYPKVETDGKFAVCGKIAYGKEEPSHLVEWIEYQRYLGASKIVFYPYQDLNKTALNVLQYYSEIGVIELVLMPFLPELKKWKRYIPYQTGIAHNDKQVPMFDTQVRFQGYKYFTIIDTDEFIAPNRRIAKTYSQLVDYLMKTYPNASEFAMHSQLYSLTWNKTNPASDLMLGQYRKRSETMIDRVKTIRVTDRVQPGSVSIHGSKSKPGYRIRLVDASEVVLKHYRLCKQTWYHPQKLSGCFGELKVQYDPYMAEIVQAIGPNVRKVKDILRL